MPPSADSDASSPVEDYLASLIHPGKPAVLALRALILGVDPRVREGIKWNAPRFHTTEHFATFHLRAKDRVQVVLHRGARPRTASEVRSAIEDPAGLLEWRGPDRAIVTFADLTEVEQKREAFAAIVRRWLEFV